MRMHALFATAVSVVAIASLSRQAISCTQQHNYRSDHRADDDDAGTPRIRHTACVGCHMARVFAITVPSPYQHLCRDRSLTTPTNSILPNRTCLKLRLRRHATHTLHRMHWQPHATRICHYCAIAVSAPVPRQIINNTDQFNLTKPNMFETTTAPARHACHAGCICCTSIPRAAACHTFSSPRVCQAAAAVCYVSLFFCCSKPCQLI